MIKETDSAYSRDEISNSANNPELKTLSTRARPDIILSTSGHHAKRRNLFLWLLGISTLFGVLAFLYFQNDFFVEKNMPFTSNNLPESVSENLPEYVKRENEDIRMYGKSVFIQLYKYVSESPNNSPNGLSCTGGFSQGGHIVDSPGPYVATCMINGTREKFDVTVVSNNNKIYRFDSNKSLGHEGDIITVQ